MQPLPKEVQHSILTDRKSLLTHTDLIPDPRYPLFEETLLYLLQMCHHFQPQRILDTGSGLTSLLLRKYNPDSLVVTVEDDDAWMEKTRKLFHRFDLDLYRNHDRSFITPKVFSQYNWKPKFDMLMHDMGNMNNRPLTLVGFVSHLTHKCTILLDNFGIFPYKELAHPFLLSKGFLPLHPTDPMTVSTDNAGGFAAYTRGHAKTQPLYNRLL